MPKYYCDYCDTFLTHDSPSVRKTHNGGRKHKENVRMFYQLWMEQQAQKLVDATARAFTQQKMLSHTAVAPPILMGGPRNMIPPGGVRPPMGLPFPFPSMPNMMVPGHPGMPPNQMPQGPGPMGMIPQRFPR